jgi:hypothetical protein
MSDFMQTLTWILYYFWIIVYAALSVLSFLRLRATAGGIILGIGFAFRALVLFVRPSILSWLFADQTYNTPAHAAFSLNIFYHIIPNLIDISIIFGIAMIPRSLRRLARTPVAAGARY